MEGQLRDVAFLATLALLFILTLQTLALTRGGSKTRDRDDRA